MKTSSEDRQPSTARLAPSLDSDNYNVAFLIMDGVYNTELTAPFDIFQHTQYRDSSRAVNVFLIADTWMMIPIIGASG